METTKRLGRIIMMTLNKLRRMELCNSDRIFEIIQYSQCFPTAQGGGKFIRALRGT